METFIVLCFTLCLVGSSKGMSICHTLSFTSKASNVHMFEVLCNAISTFVQRWNHFPFKLSELRFRRRVRHGGRSYLYPSILFFAISKRVKR